jgi:signal transduction histidine kinase
VDLLDLSKLDAGALDVVSEDIDLASLARSVADEFGPLAARREATVSAPEPGARVPAIGDSRRVTQILRILLDNALIHTPTGTSVAVTARRRGSEAAVTVSDTGPGMSPEVRAHAFERFWTGDEEGGSGLGLSIAEELARRMGGRLEVGETRGRTRFTLTLPAVRA